MRIEVDSSCFKLIMCETVISSCENVNMQTIEMVRLGSVTGGHRMDKINHDGDMLIELFIVSGLILVIQNIKSNVPT